MRQLQRTDILLLPSPVLLAQTLVPHLQGGNLEVLALVGLKTASNVFPWQILVLLQLNEEAVIVAQVRGSHGRSPLSLLARRARSFLLILISPALRGDASWVGSDRRIRPSGLRLLDLRWTRCAVGLIGGVVLEDLGREGRSDRSRLATSASGVDSETICWRPGNGIRSGTKGAWTTSWPTRILRRLHGRKRLLHRKVGRHGDVWDRRPCVDGPLLALYRR